MLTEAARRGELAVNVDRLRVDLEALRRDGVQGQLHTSDGLQGSIRDAIREGALGCCRCDEGGYEARNITGIEKDAGVEVHAHTSSVKFDQRLAGLENGIVQAGGLDLVREGLAEVQQKMASVWKTVYGSEVVMGEEVT